MKKIYLILLLGIITTVASAQKLTGQQYAEKYKDLAIEKMKIYGIPASITLAQGILESGYGASRLAVSANNHFGIKCGSNWRGAIIRHDDDQAQECFRRYDNVDDSYRDHSEFLSKSARYASLFKLKTHDYKGWAYGLKEAGYATNPEYAQKLIELIERYGLNQYDRLESPRGIIGQTIYSGEGHAPEVQPMTGRVWGRTNGVKYILAEAHDTWENLATEYKMNLQEILRLNDLKATIPIQNGDKIYIQTKKSKNKYTDIHAAVEGDTCLKIAQKYGVRLSALLKLNESLRGREPKPGEIISLQ